MDRTEFMRQLEGLLRDISPEEREEALQYYNDYFEDAGPEKEREVLEALGTPERVAEHIKREINETNEPLLGVDTGRDFPAPDKVPVRYGGSDGHATDEAYGSAPKRHTLLRTLVAPFLLLLGIIVLCVGLIVLTALFSLILGFGITFVALVLSALILVVTGVWCVPVSGLTGLALLGGGMVCAGTGLLFLMATVALAGIVTPAAARGLRYLWGRIFHPATVGQ